MHRTLQQDQAKRTEAKGGKLRGQQGGGRRQNEGAVADWRPGLAHGESRAAQQLSPAHRSRGDGCHSLDRPLRPLYPARIVSAALRAACPFTGHGRQPVQATGATWARPCPAVKPALRAATIWPAGICPAEPEYARRARRVSRGIGRDVTATARGSRNSSPGPADHRVTAPGQGARIAADQSKRQPSRYFSSCRAISTRWIWFVPS
jgi:hypothetical protein